MNLRIHAANDRPVAPRGRHVVYWMIAARRTRWSFALDHALATARQLGRPLIVLEAVRAGYRWASDRHHAFILQGMEDNAAAFAKAGITYLPYVEPEPGAGQGLLEGLARDAAIVITDEQPGFFLSRMVATVASRWPAASPASIDLATLPIDHAVRPVSYRGGSTAATHALDDFIDNKLARYGERSHPDADASSGLSPYLHFGHISAHEIAARVWGSVRWDPGRLAGAKVTGSRAGWWGLPPAAESFLDELITWRELGYGFCHHRTDHATFGALPAWARNTLAEHADDPRPERYARSDLEGAATADPIWNAAQRELLREGRIHNYLRMLWGKKILEWSPSPRIALATLVELNNKYAVDGRDPNSYSGILWTFGLFDRPWGPERPIFGKVRYMSSAATRNKLRLDRYLARFAGEPVAMFPPRLGKLQQPGNVAQRGLTRRSSVAIK